MKSLDEIVQLFILRKGPALARHASAYPRTASSRINHIWLLSRLALGFLIFSISFCPAKALVGPSARAPELAPYVVMVLKRSVGASGFCSGVVLAKDVILTAAHCAAEPANTRVHFRDEHDEPVLIDVAAVFIHPGYRADAIASRQVSIDLALIHLAAPLPARFSPITLAMPNGIKTGQNLRIAGFGVTEEGAAATSGILRAGRIAVRAPLSSILLWTEDPQRAGAGACTGDSGGPILAPDRPILVAVIDWAEGTGKQKCGSLTQGTLIAPQRHWIENVMTSWRETEPEHQ